MPAFVIYILYMSKQDFASKNQQPDRYFIVTLFFSALQRFLVDRLSILPLSGCCSS